MSFARSASLGLISGRLGWPLAFACPLVLALALSVGLRFAYQDRIVAGVRVLGLDLGGQSVTAAEGLLETTAAQVASQPVVLRVAGREWQLMAAELGVQLDAEAMAHQAYEIGRVGNPLQRSLSQWGALLFGTRVASPLLRFDARLQEGALRAVAAQVDQPAQDARIEVQVSAAGQPSIAMLSEVAGTRLLLDESAQRVREALNRGLPATAELVMGAQQPAVTRSSLEPVRGRAERLIEGPIALSLNAKRWTLSPQEVGRALIFPRSAGGRTEVRVDPTALEPALGRVRREVDQPPVAARFAWDGRGLRLIREGRDGIGVDAGVLAQLIQQRVTAGERTLVVPLQAVRPAVSGEDGPKLGIKELIKEGRTSFPGSVPEKQHNIALAASRIHGTVVPPGEIFSFNKEVGPTTIDAGYKTGWGITLASEGARTIPSVAGGICQVATTLFHPVFHAGYAMEERYPHLYWIQSYGQAPLGMKGLDATVDADHGVDLKFVNSTAEHLLIQARVEGTTLVFGLYGTKPRWDVKIEGPLIRNVVQTDREPVRQEEPTMPSGRSLQVEAAQDGFDVTVARTVTSGDDVRRLDLRSHYLPSRNVILHGPEPADSEQPGEPSRENPPPRDPR